MRRVAPNRRREMGRNLKCQCYVLTDSRLARQRWPDIRSNLERGWPIVRRSNFERWWRIDRGSKLERECQIVSSSNLERENPADSRNNLECAALQAMRHSL